MGQDKALLPLGGQPLAQRMGQLVRQVCQDVTLVGSRATYSHLGFRVIEDIFPDHGPLGGIHAALGHSSLPFSLIVGCDMPYLSTEFLELLIELAIQSGADAVVPGSAASGYEPLCAVYSRLCLGPIETALRAGQVRTQSAIERLKLHVVGCQEWLPYDRDGKLFCNLNTPEDYREALDQTRSRGGRQEPATSGGDAALRGSDF